MTFFEVYGIGALAILGLMTLLWVASLILRNSSIVDIFWGPGFVLANWVYFALTHEGYAGRKWLIGVIVTVWGLRLGSHILWRNRGKGEDFRYRQLREKAPGRWWWQSFFVVFLLQVAWMWLISAPLLAAQIGEAPARLIWLDYAALALWGVGFFFEAAGDWQLARFKAVPTNKGKVLDRGIWRYTRHPNYFGDATQWWAFYLVGAAAGSWWTVFSPIIFTALLLRVTGVLRLEMSLVETKPQYREYIETTSAFVPWFPSRKQ